MNKTLITAIALALSSSVHATNTPQPKPMQEQDQLQYQQQYMKQLQDQHQKQDQETNVTVGDQSNEQNIAFTSPDDVTIRNTASANPPSVYGSHSCAIGASAGIGIPAVNISGGRQKIDLACEDREIARLLFAFGERELAVIMICKSRSAVELLGVACGPSITQEELMRRIELLQNKQERTEEICEESKDRILKACVEK